MPEIGTESLLEVPESRRAGLQRIAERLLSVRSVALTTHVNADGDGAGSEVAVAAWLEANGVGATIVNPTPFPEQFRFLLGGPGLVAEWEDGGPDVLESADLLLVLDTNEPKRIGPLAERITADRTLVVDHHPAGTAVMGGAAVLEPVAAATGELVYDMISLRGGPWPPAVVQGIYVALVTDTGSFRFANTSPRTHAIAADLLRRGIDPEAIYRRLFGAVPRRRLELLRDALGTLDHDPKAGLSWIVVSDAMIRRSEATTEDLDGLVEQARSIQGTEIALLFRETSDGQTKISLRSNGDADVNRIAREFGGGGHVKAAGALIPAPVTEVVPRVLEAARRQH